MIINTYGLLPVERLENHSHEHDYLMGKHDGESKMRVKSNEPEEPFGVIFDQELKKLV